MFCVYIIYSKKIDRFYIGTTDDFEKRFMQHNNKMYVHAFTTRGIPWEYFLVIEKLSSKQAYAIEKYIKSMKSSTYIRNLVKYPEMTENLKKRFCM